MTSSLATADEPKYQTLSKASFGERQRAALLLSIYANVYTGHIIPAYTGNRKNRIERIPLNYIQAH